MQRSARTRLFLAILVVASASLGLTGCVSRALPVASSQGLSVQGSVHGGRQPVSGAQLELYAEGVGGAPAAQLLRFPVSTDANGSFSFGGLYTCNSSTDQVYLVSIGGDPGTGFNSSLVLMAALGNCGGLGDSTFISMNEVTTVAAVYALAPYMTPGSRLIGTADADPTALVAANAYGATLADFSSGRAFSTGGPNAAQRQMAIDSLADSIAACANTVGGGPCNTLFADATPANGVAPTDTVSALVNIVRNPTFQAADVYNLAGAEAPFQPTLQTAPTDWTLP